ncbi:hypothetical protein [Rufibacter roseus]|uniref:SH3 domain-containing protein n=1 Tax=Rufibacter roseus TaxID=1567108 RepID=A0ABW2DEH4_9BACT|nr:hypothetical protein [Rufibacter roseus]
MNIFYFLLVLSFLPFRTAIIQKPCELLVNPDYTETIRVYEKPEGNLVTTVAHDVEAEDFILLSVTQQTSNFYFAAVSFAVSGKSYKGWIKKGKHIGTYARDYDAATPLTLYKEPSTYAGVSVVASERVSNFLEVTSINEGWVRVKLNMNGRVIQGWLSPEAQCSNPYTTCN